MSEEEEKEKKRWSLMEGLSYAEKPFVFIFVFLFFFGFIIGGRGGGKAVSRSFHFRNFAVWKVVE